MKLIRPCIGGAFLCLGYFVLVAAAPLHGVMKPIPEAVPRVAVIHLLFDDQVYNGMVVYVRGYLDSSRLEAILYPTREDALMQNEPLGISIEDLSVLHTKNTCSDRFVAVKGTFRMGLT